MALIDDESQLLQNLTEVKPQPIQDRAREEEMNEFFLNVEDHFPNQDQQTPHEIGRAHV